MIIDERGVSRTCQRKQFNFQCLKVDHQSVVSKKIRAQPMNGNTLGIFQRRHGNHFSVYFIPKLRTDPYLRLAHGQLPGLTAETMKNPVRWPAFKEKIVEHQFGNPGIQNEITGLPIDRGPHNDQFAGQLERNGVIGSERSIDYG